MLEIKSSTLGWGTLLLGVPRQITMTMLSIGRFSQHRRFDVCIQSSRLGVRTVSAIFGVYLLIFRE